MSGGMLGDLDGTTDAICSYARVSRWVEDAPRRERARVEDSPRRVRVLLSLPVPIPSPPSRPLHRHPVLYIVIPRPREGSKAPAHHPPTSPHSTFPSPFLLHHSGPRAGRRYAKGESIPSPFQLKTVRFPHRTVVPYSLLKHPNPYLDDPQ